MARKCQKTAIYQSQILSISMYFKILFFFLRIWKEYESIHNYEELQIQSANIFGRKMSKHALAILLNYSDSNSRRSGPFIKVSVTPSLNTQSCIRSPLCSTFRFENLSISPKKTSFFNFFKLFQ